MTRILSSQLKKTLKRDVIPDGIQHRKHAHKHPHHRDLPVFSMKDVRSVIAESQRFHSEHAEEMIAHEKTKVNTPLPSQPRPKSRVVASAGLADLLGFDPRQFQTFLEKNEKNVPEKFKKYYDRLMALKTKIQNPLSNPQIEGFDIDFALALMPSEAEALQEIEKAMDRIFNGTYGLCEVTGQAIDEERLLAIPFARCSVEGQAEKERQSNQRVPDAERIFLDGMEEIPVVYDEEMEVQE
ncbi:MAG: TraR/DksA family transcriptional regulator [Puniceicoccales bacterium]|nr:TraR/DksA family transcriptional regulator [Puniceicoccales bacterium]